MIKYSVDFATGAGATKRAAQYKYDTSIQKDTEGLIPNNCVVILYSWGIFG